MLETSNDDFITINNIELGDELHNKSPCQILQKWASVPRTFVVDCRFYEKIDNSALAALFLEHFFATPHEHNVKLSNVPESLHYNDMNTFSYWSTFKSVFKSMLFRERSAY